MKIKIDQNSTLPLYRQVISAVKEALRDGKLKNGDPMPSLSELAGMTGISPETAKKAYNLLKKENLIGSRQGKGYFIDVRESGAPLRILMLVDKLSAYKLAIHKGLTEALVQNADVSINIHNQDIELFDKLVCDANGEFDWYIIAAHFPRKVSAARIARTLKRLPNNRTILIDNGLPQFKGNIGRVYQDFREDASHALKDALGMIHKYDSVEIITTANSLYGDIICPQIRKLFRSEGIRCRIEQQFNPEQMSAGTLYIVLCGQLDNDHFTLIREANRRGYVLGQDIGLISYNDEPVNEFICGGLSSISSDFTQMGHSVAEMINSGKLSCIHNPFRLIVRSSL